MKKYILLLVTVNIFLLVQSQPESPWLISGNSGTIPGIHFLGTTDNKPLRFRVNNLSAGELDTVGGRTNFGVGAGINMTLTGAHNVAIGFNALFSNTNGYSNTAVGYYALYGNVGGYYNTAVGNFALRSNLGYGNTAMGRSALAYNTTGYFNTATGYQSLVNNTTGFLNTATGFNALAVNTSGSYNTANGENSLYINSSGRFNTAMGSSSLTGNTTGGNNTAIGYSTLYYNSAAYNNTAIGYNAAHAYSMGWNNTIIGANSDVNGVGYYNCVALGESVTCTASSQARIGNSSTVSIGGYVGWSNISDGRYKKDISQNVKGLDFIMKLQPVTYHLDVSGLNKKLNADRDQQPNKFNQQAITEKEQILFSGFVAQDVEKAAKEAGYDFSGIDKPRNENDLYGLRYAEFVVPLVKAVQELSNQNTELKNQLDEIKKTSSDQKKLNDDLIERVKRLESSFVTKK